MRSVLLLSAILATTTAAAEGQFSGVSTKGNLSVWRVNHGNGAVSLCSFEGHKNEPGCYPWSSGGAAGNYQIIGGDDVLSTWRINASTGAVSLCEYKDVANPPICTPWSSQ
jgi:hypothetical protein